ncbi:MAG: hypothetical protein H8F28_11800 [Fibrella sp.]|nr:hypothetical protein [Armatimonadota bacterium]
MGLAKKLREVVAANFIEIARVETPPVKEETVPAPEATPAALGTYAEAELDSFLKDIGASPVAETPAGFSDAVSIEPELIAEPVPPTPVLVSLADAVSNEGDVDFARIFEQYEVPATPFSAEQAMNMLQSLPRDLALRTKRVTVNTTLSAIGKVVGATPQDIVGDAIRKKQTLEQYVESLGREVDETSANTQAEIERLQAEIAAHKDALRSLTRKRSAASEVCRSRMDLFDQVTHFFDYDEATLNAPETAAEEETGVPTDEMPAFMREDAVRRMLGINEDFTNENGEFDAMKFAQMYGSDTQESAESESDNSEDTARRPRAKK